MFARVAEMIAKPGQVNSLCQALHEMVLPVMQKQPGFINTIVMALEDEPRVVLLLSFWTSALARSDYEQDLASRVNQMIAPLVDSPGKQRAFDVKGVAALALQIETLALNCVAA